MIYHNYTRKEECPFVGINLEMVYNFCMTDQNQELQNYIQQSRQSGKIDEQIQQELLDAGWGEKDVSTQLSKPSQQTRLNKFLNITRIIEILNFFFLIGMPIWSLFFPNTSGLDGFAAIILFSWIILLEIPIILLICISVVLSLIKWRFLKHIDKIFLIINILFIILITLIFVYLLLANR